MVTDVFFGSRRRNPFERGQGRIQLPLLAAGRQFRARGSGIIEPIDLDPYYKDEIILGFEWQFTRNWAFDAKAMYWELGDMIMNTTQRDPNGQTFLSSSVRQLPRQPAPAGSVPDQLIDAFEGPLQGVLGAPAPVPGQQAVR